MNDEKDARAEAKGRLASFVLSGDAERGGMVLQRILAHAVVTDEQQQFMYRSLALTPADARDLVKWVTIYGGFDLSIRE